MVCAMLNLRLLVGVAGASSSGEMQPTARFVSWNQCGSQAANLGTRHKTDEPPAKVRPDRVSERAAGKEARERRRARRVGRRQVARHRARRRHRLLRQPDRQPAREQQQQRPVRDAGAGDGIADGGAGKREQQHQLAAARV